MSLLEHRAVCQPKSWPPVPPHQGPPASLRDDGWGGASTSTLTLRICTLIRENSCCRVGGRPSGSDFFSSRRLLGGSSFKTSRRERFHCWKTFLKWIQRAVLGYLPRLGDTGGGAPHLKHQGDPLPSSSPWLELCWCSAS